MTALEALFVTGAVLLPVFFQIVGWALSARRRAR